MNDLENKLRSLTFREPPPGWRGALTGGAAVEAGWRKWLSPHPAAWAALAAIWLALALVSRTFERPAPSGPSVAAQRDPDPLVEPTLFAFQLRAASGLEPSL